MVQKTHLAQLESLAWDRLERARYATSSPRGNSSVSASSAKEEERAVKFSFWLGVACLLQDQPCSPSCLGGFKRLFNSVLDSRDVLGFIEACGYIRQRLVSDGCWPCDLSKGHKPRWVRGISIAIENAIESSLITHPSPTFNRVATFLGWLKRLPVYIRDISDSIDEYYTCDRRISSISFDENVYVPMLASIWKEWFGAFKLRPPFRPKHGSGSTADVGRVRHDKWRTLSVDRRAQACLRYSNLERCTDIPLGDAIRVSKVVFVPKQAGKDRTICMEPAWLQFLQQGVADQLTSFTHHGSHPLSRLVNIYSQDVNRRLCAEAYQHLFATIDLSDASDSVSWRLIGALCKDLPIYRYLFATRSIMTDVYGYRSQMDKFAPMGSALCFPIECYVFASVVELAYRIHYGQASRGFRSGCSVYGDDIICPSVIYDHVVQILTSLGFVVNSRKSFSSGNYYESCGVEYCYGAKIETIKHPRSILYCHEDTVPEQIGLVTDLANSMLLAGYYDARRLLLRFFSGTKVVIGSRRVPFMEAVRFDDRNLIPVSLPYRTYRWNSNLQRSVCSQLQIQYRPTKAQSDYLQWRHDQVEISREARLKMRKFKDPHPKWTEKGVRELLRLGHIALVTEGDIQEVESTRTGRLHLKLRKHSSPPGY